MPVTQITAIDAFDLLKSDANSLLIDVRTHEEFNFVGLVDSSYFNDRMFLLPWQIFPRMEENPEFAAGLEKVLKKIFDEKFRDAKIIFICRTGGRSNQAANYANNIGYKSCYNLVSGFEGDLDQQEQRGKINGWKANKLPWRQK